MKKFSSATIWFLVLILVVISAFSLLDGSSTLKEISATQFETYMAKNEVTDIEVSADATAISGKLADGTEFTTGILKDVFLQIKDKYPNENMNIKYAKPVKTPLWMSLLPTLVLVGVSVLFLVIFMNQSSGGGNGRGVMNFGKSRAKMAVPLEGDKKITFKNVAGAEEEKQELEIYLSKLKRMRLV